MSAWAVFLAEQQHETERLIHHDTLELSAPADGTPASRATQVLVLAGEPAQVVALGRVRDSRAADGDGRWWSATPAGSSTSRCRPTACPPWTRWPPVRLPRCSRRWPTSRRGGREPARTATRTGRTGWSACDLPIEAATPAEAVRLFWSYVQELGPRELPAFVSPSRDELAMQAFVLGAEANQDPEEDDEEQ